LQKALGLPEDIPCFDLSAACTGFLYALHTMECLLNAAPRKFGLVVGAEVISRIIDWSDRSTCILFGDGAGAAVVECREGWPSIGAVLGCRGDDELLRVAGVEAGERSFLHMDGTKVFKFAVETVPAAIDEVLKKTGNTVEDIDFFVFHQANARIIDLAVRKYHIPPEKYYKNIDEYGNTSAASIPLVLSELQDQGKIGPGSRTLVVGFGGGLTWGSAIIEFA
jgi:3-oxoacyl-[acyl-carrier-protein] synthase-3